MVVDRFIFNYNETKVFPCFSFIPKTGVGYLKHSLVFTVYPEKCLPKHRKSTLSFQARLLSIFNLSNQEDTRPSRWNHSAVGKCTNDDRLVERILSILEWEWRKTIEYLKYPESAEISLTHSPYEIFATLRGIALYHFPLDSKLSAFKVILLEMWINGFRPNRTKF